MHIASEFPGLCAKLSDVGRATGNFPKKEHLMVSLSHGVVFSCLCMFGPTYVWERGPAALKAGGGVELALEKRRGTAERRHPLQAKSLGTPSPSRIQILKLLSETLRFV